MQKSNIKLFQALFILLFLIFSCSKKKIKQDMNNDTVINKTINPQEYKVNQNTSVLTWVGRKISSGHNGTIMLKDGYVNVSTDGIIDGEFNIDMNSISVSDLQGGGKASLERHLKNEDFFSVNDFPLSKLVTLATVFKGNVLCAAVSPYIS